MFHSSRYACAQTIRFHDVFHDKCFTICLFISPDLDGHRAPQMISLRNTICFTIFMFEVLQQKLLQNLKNFSLSKTCKRFLDFRLQRRAKGIFTTTTPPGLTEGGQGVDRSINQEEERRCPANRGLKGGSMMGFNASYSNRDGLLDRVSRRRHGGELRCCRRSGSVNHLVALSALVVFLLPTSRAAEGVRGGTVRGLGVAGDVAIKSGEALASSRRGRGGDVEGSEMRRLQKMEGILNAEIDVVDTLQRVMQQEEGHGDRQLIATPEERHRKRGAGNKCHDLADLERSEACSIAQESCKPPNGLFNYMEMSYCVVPSKIFSAIILIAWLVVLFMWITSMVDFLVPSLACMAQACGLKESVAGVTFLALGNGSSDIFSLCAATGELPLLTLERKS
jgi:hypothetical protein